MKKRFKTKGMTCDNCEKIITKQVKKLEGIKNIKVDYATETADVEFDEDKVKFDDITQAIETKGYICEDVPEENKSKKFGWIFALIGIVVIGYFILQFADTISLPTISENMGYGLLFLVGLLTGFHCVSMCGGFVVSYTTKGAKEGRKPHQLHFSYALGKTISYTVIGAGFGLLGSIIAFTPMMRGVAGIIAGLFLVIFGLKMLNVFPALRKFSIKLPKFVNKFVAVEHSKRSNSPLIIGLLNGLMIACGPLQAIYIMAAGTGSMIEGAKLLFVFGLGTLPVLLGFGYLTSIISAKATHKILKVSGAVVILLGLVMVNRGLALTGTGYDLNTITGNFAAEDSNGTIEMQDGYQIIRMDVNRYGWSPDKFALKKDVPVRWIINGKEINGCNNAINVPKLNLEFDVKQGEQVIEFTPTELGTIPWSCWMGMIPGTFIVKDDLTNPVELQQELKAIQQPKGSCGGKCGKSSCGAARGGGCGCGRK